MRSLLKISHTLKTFYAKLHLLICESDCQNCGLIFKMHMVALFDLIIQLRYGPLWLCWREKHWLYIVWLAPPLRQPAIWFFAVAGWRRGKNRGLRTAGWRVWHSTCIWQKGKYSSGSLKVPETERTKTFLCCGILWCFCWQPGPEKCWKAGWMEVSNYFDCIRSPCEDWAAWTWHWLRWE